MIELVAGRAWLLLGDDEVQLEPGVRLSGRLLSEEDGFALLECCALLVRVEVSSIVTSFGRGRLPERAPV